jgi:hypothetical protein
MTRKRSHGEGTIQSRGENCWRLRYRVGGQRFTKTFRGSLSDARKELRRLIRSGDVGEHVAPDKITLADWIDRWLALLERQRRSYKSPVIRLFCKLISGVGLTTGKQAAGAPKKAEFIEVIASPAVGARPGRRP